MLSRRPNKGTDIPVFQKMNCFDSFLASGDFCLLLKTFANSLDPDQDQQNVGPDRGPNSLTLLFLKEFFEKVNFEKNSTEDKI